MFYIIEYTHLHIHRHTQGKLSVEKEIICAMLYQKHTSGEQRMKRKSIYPCLTLLLFAAGMSIACAKLTARDECKNELTIRTVRNPGVSVTKIFYHGDEEVARQVRGKHEVLVETTGTIPDGIFREYYPSGKLMEETPYVNGMRVGLSTWYYETGIVQGERTYKEDKLDGIIKWYYTTGSLGTEFNYKDGKLEGLTKLYWENGNLKAEDYYINGRRDGVKTLYYDSGELRFVYTYDNGKKINRKEYSKTGALIKTETY